MTTVSKNTLSLITLLIHTTDTVALFTALQFAELEVVLKNKWLFGCLLESEQGTSVNLWCLDKLVNMALKLQCQTCNYHHNEVKTFWNCIWSFNVSPSLNTQSCIKGLLGVQYFCFWAVWAAWLVLKKKVGGQLWATFEGGFFMLLGSKKF